MEDCISVVGYPSQAYTWFFGPNLHSSRLISVVLSSSCFIKANGALSARRERRSARTAGTSETRIVEDRWMRSYRTEDMRVLRWDNGLGAKGPTVAVLTRKKETSLVLAP
jgi:hypothetical protein